MRTFVIGDCHGHIDRLTALLVKAGLIVPVEGTDGIFTRQTDDEIVQLGDLANCGKSADLRDRECYELAKQLGMIVLWGNHEYATEDSAYMGFAGYREPFPETLSLIREVAPRFFYLAHGFLLTHAGLHPAYVRYRKSDDVPTAFAGSYDPIALPRSPVVRDIGVMRGGNKQHGGILWRDAREELWDGMPQIFGHTRSSMVRKYHDKSYCIDVGGHHDGNLAGIWLPECKVVAVGPNAEMNEAVTP